MSGFFSDPDLFRTVRAEVAPCLRTYPTARVWIPVCGTGEDAISTAIVLREERVSRVSIYATDSDGGTFSMARAGVMSSSGLSEARYFATHGRASLAEYFLEGERGVTVRPSILQNIVFAEHDLATDSSINEFQLVLLFASVDTLAPEVKTRAFRLFEQSLCRLGFMAFGTSSLLRPSPDVGAYSRLGPARLYRKLR